MLTIIGCGNPNRGDDGVGVAIAQRLQTYLADHPIPEVQVFDCGTAGIEVMFRAKGSDRLIIIDASSTGSEPGAIFEVPGAELESLANPNYNLHDFRWDHALAAGRKLFAIFPEDVTVYLIEAEHLGFSLELSPVVARSSEIVFSKIVASLGTRIY
jgi:hydrogenase maturation protease